MTHKFESPFPKADPIYFSGYEEFIPVEAIVSGVPMERKGSFRSDRLALQYVLLMIQTNCEVVLEDPIDDYADDPYGGSDKRRINVYSDRLITDVRKVLKALGYWEQSIRVRRDYRGVWVVQLDPRINGNKGPLFHV